MNTDQLLRLLHEDAFTGKIVHSVMAKNECWDIYEVLRKTGNTAAIIVNTDPSDMPGLHWVAYYMKDRNCEFFDSYGCSPQTYNLPKANQHNTVSIQSIASMHCGVFVTYYLLCRCRNISLSHILSKFYHDPYKLSYNDDLVVNYLNNHEYCEIKH